MERYTWVRFAGKLTPCHTHRWQQSAHQWGAGRKKGKSRRRAHIDSLISVHVGVGQRCRARDVEPPTRLPIMSTHIVSAGRWVKVQGMVNASTHICCYVLVHVGVGQRCRACAQDVESPAILPTMSTRNVPAVLNHEALRYGFNLSRRLT